jgi:hypothetical protein
MNRITTQGKTVSAKEKKGIAEKAQSGYRWLISGIWFVNITRQIIVTGGNIAESAFLLATLWVITNSVAHPLLTWFLSIHIIELLNYLAAIAFSALPELILIPVIIVCFTHWYTGLKHQNKASIVWAILYSIPTLFFFVMTIIAITTFVSTGGTHFTPIDGTQLVIRCLSGWIYAVINMLFDKLGSPHYGSIIDSLKQEIESEREQTSQTVLELNEQIEKQKARYTTEIEELKARFEDVIERLNTENDSFKTLLTSQQNKLIHLEERASSLVLEPLERNYPLAKTEWIDKSVKSVSLDEIVRITGVSKRKIQNATLRKTGRNGELYLVSSVIEWLKTIPVTSNGNGNGNGHSQDTEALSLPILSLVGNE